MGTGERGGSRCHPGASLCSPVTRAHRIRCKPPTAPRTRSAAGARNLSSVAGRHTDTKRSPGATRPARGRCPAVHCWLKSRHITPIRERHEAPSSAQASDHNAVPACQAAGQSLTERRRCGVGVWVPGRDCASRSLSRLRPGQRRASPAVVRLPDMGGSYVVTGGGSGATAISCCAPARRRRHRDTARYRRPRRVPRRRSASRPRRLRSLLPSPAGRQRLQHDNDRLGAERACASRTKCRVQNGE